MNSQVYNSRQGITNRVKNLLRPIKYSFARSYAVLSYSQEGEDMILNRFFSNKRDGFYIDVGAHHPWRFSNTYFFYTRGWNGINIDPMPGSMNLFNRKRTRDINLEIGIAEQDGQLDYYMFNEPALNSFSYAATTEALKNAEFKLINKLKIETAPLSKILDIHVKDGKKIDFLTIDAEGFDIEVLKSNNWDKYRPGFVLAESSMSKLEEINRCPIYNFMNKQGYQLIAKTAKTFFYQNQATL